MGIHREGWGILGWDDHAHTILTAAMGSGDPQAREAATALTNSPPGPARAQAVS